MTKASINFVLLASGGMDSTTLAYWLRSQQIDFLPVEALHFEVERGFIPQPVARMFLLPKNGMPMRVTLRKVQSYRLLARAGL